MLLTNPKLVMLFIDNTMQVNGCCIWKPHVLQIF